MVLKTRVASGESAGTEDPATVLICYGDPIVGRALELLLRNAVYAAKYVTGDYLERSGASRGMRVLLLDTGWDAQSRAGAVGAASSTANRRNISILELGESFDDTKSGPESHVPWPYRTEDLTRRIDASVPAEPRADVGAKTEGGRT